MSAARGTDRRLLALCAKLSLRIMAHKASAPYGESALARAGDMVLATAIKLARAKPVTMEGIQAKARAAYVLACEDGGSPRSDGLVHDVMIALVRDLAGTMPGGLWGGRPMTNDLDLAGRWCPEMRGRPAPCSVPWLPPPAEPPPASPAGWIWTGASATGPDASLLRLCDRIVAAVDMEAALRPYFRVVAEAEYERLAAPVDAEWTEVETGLAVASPPVTIAGARAAATAALALQPQPEREASTMAQRLAWLACRFLVAGGHERAPGPYFPPSETGTRRKPKPLPVPPPGRPPG
jgi:hypothetical protein